MALMYNNNGGATNRRRRDSRGRYMEGDYGMRSEYGGGMQNNYGARNEYDLYVMPQGRQMGFGAQDAYDVNDNDIRRRNTGREDGYFSEQGEHQRYPTGAYGGQMRMSAQQGGMKQQQMRMGGMKQHGMPEGYVPPLTRDKAMEWVQGMQGEGGSDGETWTFEEIEEIAKKNGIPKQEKKLVELYAVMNMLASDYYTVAEEFDVLNDEFFVCMAKAFINDKDAVPDKVAMYYECIAKKD